MIEMNCASSAQLNDVRFIIYDN